MKDKKEIRAGTIRINRIVLLTFISKFFTGKAKFVNKNLELISIRRNDGDLPMLSTYYDFTFVADDLPIVPEGCWPLFVIYEKVEGKTYSYKLIEKPYEKKKV